MSLKLQKRLAIRLFTCTLVIMACLHTKTQAEPTDPFALLNLPAKPFNYANIKLPDHYLTTPNGRGDFLDAAIMHDNTPADNPTTNAGATLGRVLFYDNKLSAKGNMACASCHKQDLGFADDAPLSLGFEGGTTRRHSMGLANARFYQSGKFFWDERAATLEDQVLMPFQDAVEMGLTLDQLVQIVQSQPYYPPLFQNAFGDKVVTSDRIAKALAQFVRSMVSINTKYDRGRKQVSSPRQPFPNFTDRENAGKRLFFTANGPRAACSQCHATDAFISSFPGAGPYAASGGSNNGLEGNSIEDLGIAETTGDYGDMGKFKAPSLRNVALTAPYMHDGSLATLENVIDHYSSGIQPHPNLHRILRRRGVRALGYNFSAEEKTALIAFFKTLTDKDLISDPKYSDPFE